MSEREERKALRNAIEHLEHMAAWISANNSGYSFEALGEDMPDIKAALANHASEAKGAGEAIAKAARPWADFHGPLPDYDHPLRCVYESGVQYAVELLAKELDVTDYNICDGTEEFDGDLGGTLFNIVLAALPKDQHGDPLYPNEVLPAIEAAAKAGWVACRKQVYALAEDTDSSTSALWSQKDQASAFARGRRHEAKSIARALHALGPENCDELAAALSPYRAGRSPASQEEANVVNEASLENEIQAKGLNAPRLNPALIDDTIVGADYHVFPGTTLTVCALTLRNGFIVTGESAAASPENFDVEIGKKIARDNARQKIWALEGYLLRERLAAASNPACTETGKQ